MISKKEHLDLSNLISLIKKKISKSNKSISLYSETYNYVFSYQYRFKTITPTDTKYYMVKIRPLNRNIFTTYHICDLHKYLKNRDNITQNTIDMWCLEIL